MYLYCEKRNPQISLFVQTAGNVCFGVFVMLVPFLKVFATDWHGGRRTALFLGFLSPPLCLAIIFRILGRYIHKIDRITHEEILSTATHGLWMRERFSRIPIRSIVKASLVELTSIQAHGDDEVRGVRLRLDDGSSRFIAFEYPAKALAAIEEAMGRVG
jgi:hypothetical protein